ncbi:hypothetical protein F4806DRAFT_415248 [Annulohypoxylon nitens]|nr:hypothetical protein F4806DRAFT_415248 [Annulohypoxylon nitens]
MIVAYYCCCYRILHQAGFLVHEWDMSNRTLYEVLYVGNMAASFYEVAISTLKVAILLEWNKIFAPNRTPKYFYWTCHVLLWINIIYYIITVTIKNIVCYPTPNSGGEPNSRSCVNRVTAEAVSATLNLVSHILIFFLPQRIIWKLNMTFRRKICVSLVFFIGIAVVVIGICRLAATIQYFTNVDRIYIAFKVYFWCALELMLVVLVFCIPTIPRVFQESTRSWKIRALSRPWSRFFTGRSRINEDPAKTDVEKHPAVANNT